MLHDLKVVGVFIQDKACRCFRLAREVAAIGEIALLIDTHAHLRQRSELFIVLIQLHVAVAVAVEFKHSPGQLVFGIVPIHLGKLHRAADQRVFQLQFDHSAVLIHVDLKGLVGEDVAGGRRNLMHDPVSIGDFGKRKAAVL